MFDVLHKRRDSLKQNNRGQVLTGWPDLGDKLGGSMRAGSLVIVGARPSVGKTSATLDMALFAAQAGMPALFVSLEQSQIDIANRLLCANTTLPFADIELDRLTDPLDRDRLADAENQLAALPLKIIDGAHDALCLFLECGVTQRVPQHRPPSKKVRHTLTLRRRRRPISFLAVRGEFRRRERFVS